MSKEKNSSSDERRSEPRMDGMKFHSVEIKLDAPLPIYQFNLRDISENGVCILVKDDSPILTHLKVGQELALKYYALDDSKNNIVKEVKTKIRHITKGEPGNYNGHYMVGVMIVE